MYPQVLTALLGRDLPASAAQLDGYARYAVAIRGCFPAIVAAAGKSVTGRLLHNVPGWILETLDEYEDVAGGLYVRESVRVRLLDDSAASTYAPAETYLAGPRLAGRLKGDWDEEFFRRHKLQSYLDNDLSRDP